MSFTVTILGSASAKLTPGRHPSAQVVNLHEQHYLVDAGGGYAAAVVPLRNQSAAAAGRLFSHLHGDHCFGLFPLLSTLGLYGRRTPLPVYAPALFGEFSPATCAISTANCPTTWSGTRSIRPVIGRSSKTVRSEVWSIPAAPPRPHVRLPLPRKRAAAERRQIQNHEIRPLDRADHRRQTGRSRAARFGRDAAQRGS